MRSLSTRGIRSDERQRWPCTAVALTVYLCAANEAVEQRSIVRDVGTRLRRCVERENFTELSVYCLLALFSAVVQLFCCGRELSYPQLYVLVLYAGFLAFISFDVMRSNA
jgi:hypothetical protein